MTIAGITRYTIKSGVSLVALAVIAISTTGCDLTEPTFHHQQQVQVRESRFSESFETHDIDDTVYSKVASAYARNGEGPVHVTITYEPRSKSNTASHATGHLARILRGLQKHGVENVKGDILPISDRGVESKTMISYMSYSAHAPRDCTMMPGVEEHHTYRDEEYKLGCTFDTIMAKQIARPGDLLGNSGADGAGDATRHSTIVESYRNAE